MKVQLVLLIGVIGLLQYAAGHKVLVFGDWGQEKTSSSRPGQELTARAMGKYLEQNSEIKYIVSTGDNFYSDGVTSPESERFDSSWRDVYWVPEYPVMESLEWYISVGNHDHTDDFDELHQVTFGDLEPKWTCPHLWFDWVDVEDDFSVHWIVIDSQSLRKSKHDKAEQYAWFEETLASSTATYIIVVGHHTHYSAGYYAGSSTLRNNIQPLMEQYKVDLYICGHDHNLQHVKHQDASQMDHFVDYVVSGGGGRNLYDLESENLSEIRSQGYELEFFEYDYGINTIEFNAEEMVVDFYSPDSNEDMQLVYSFRRPARSKGLRSMHSNALTNLS